MKYLLDTNVCIQYLNQRSEKIIQRLQDLSDIDIVIKTTKPLRERFMMRQSYDYPQAMPTFILSSDLLIVNI